MSTVDLTVEPIAVWDVQEPRFWKNHKECSQWLTDHDLHPEELCRVEFYLIDGPVARLIGYCCDRPDHDWNGHTCLRLCRVVLRDVLLSEFPPRELL